jgi:hypothetical protein
MPTIATTRGARSGTRPHRVTPPQGDTFGWRLYSTFLREAGGDRARWNTIREFYLAIFGLSESIRLLLEWRIGPSEDAPYDDETTVWGLAAARLFVVNRLIDPLFEQADAYAGEVAKAKRERRRDDEQRWAGMERAVRANIMRLAYAPPHAPKVNGNVVVQAKPADEAHVPDWDELVSMREAIVIDLGEIGLDRQPLRRALEGEGLWTLIAAPIPPGAETSRNVRRRYRNRLNELTVFLREHPDLLKPTLAVTALAEAEPAATGRRAELLEALGELKRHRLFNNRLTDKTKRTVDRAETIEELQDLEDLVALVREHLAERETSERDRRQTNRARKRNKGERRRR